MRKQKQLLKCWTGLKLWIPTKKNTIPSKQSVWLPSRHTQMSKHCSSRLRNKINFRSRSCDWMEAMHCWGKAENFYSSHDFLKFYRSSRKNSPGLPLGLTRWGATQWQELTWCEWGMIEAGSLRSERQWLACKIYVVTFQPQLNRKKKIGNVFLFIKQKQTIDLSDKVKIAVRVPLERDGLERARPLVSKIYI